MCESVSVSRWTFLFLHICVLETLKATRHLIVVSSVYSLCINYDRIAAIIIRINWKQIQELKLNHIW